MALPLRWWSLGALALLGGLALAAAPGGHGPAAAEAGAHGGAAAHPPGSGSAGPDLPVRVQVEEDSRVLALPMVDPEWVELRLSGYPGDLRAALLSRTTRDLPELQAVPVGGGDWFLRARLSRPGHEVMARVERGDLLISVSDQPLEPPLRRVISPSVEQLLGGHLPESPQPEAPPTLRPLGGDLMSLGLDPEDHVMVFSRAPDWIPLASWEAVDRAREAMYAARGPVDEARARYRLGLLYMELDFAREARVYLNSVADREGLPAAELSLARARAAGAVGRWEEARDLYDRAHREGAADSAVLEGLALVSLATGAPPRAPTGRALASSTAWPESVLLAAELMQRDGAYMESRPLLEALEGRVPSGILDRYNLRLGDARYAAGDYALARGAWSRVPGDLGRVRSLMADLAEAPTAGTWAEKLPQIVQASVPRDAAGAEALYLLAQVDIGLAERGGGGEIEEAIHSLATILRRQGRKARGSDVPEMFWEAYAGRVQGLARQGRWFDLAALHESVWDRSVRRAVTEPGVLVTVSRAYEEVGLPEQAVSTLKDAIAIVISRGGQDPAMVLHLAELQAQARDWNGGLTTLAFLRSSGADLGPVAGRVELVEAALLEGKGDLEGAADALRRAAEDPQWRDTATLRLALMETANGRCERAVPTLERLLYAEDGEERFREPTPWLALARCQLAAGRQAEARRSAQVAEKLAESDDEQRYATWLATRADPSRDPGELSEGPDIWGALSRENKADAEFRQELERRSQTEWTRP